MNTKHICEHLDIFLMEWRSTQKMLDEHFKNPIRQQLPKGSVSMGDVLGGTLISKTGYFHLNEAARLILIETKLDKRISLETAVKVLDDNTLDAMRSAQPEQNISLRKITASAADQLHKIALPMITFVYPTIVSGAPDKVDIRFGAVRLISKCVFEAEFETHFEKIKKETKPNIDSIDQYIQAWKQYANWHQHFVLVEVSNHEQAMAKIAAIQAADFVLNFFRLCYGWRAGHKIRLAGEMITQEESASITLCNDELIITRHRRWDGASLEENWPQKFENSIYPFHQMIGSIASRFVSGQTNDDPVFERISYSSHLITEAYAERSDRLKLVKIISALETLALLPDGQKATGLAKRCALAVSDGTDVRVYDEINSIVFNAYKRRNNVVHGDAPFAAPSAESLRALEGPLIEIVVCMIRLLLIVRKKNRPQSIRALRKKITEAYDTLENGSGSVGWVQKS